MKEKTKLHTSLSLAWVLLSVLCIACVLVWYSVLSAQPTGKLKVAFLDVGQGDAIYIETPQGTQVLIDGGKGKSVLRALGSVIPLFDRSIDVVLATHPDADHIEGLPEVLARYRIGMFFESGVQDEGALSQELHKKVAEENLRVTYAREGMTLILDTDVTLRVLFPDRNVENMEANTSSAVVQLVYKDTSFMFTGDAPVGIETYLATLYGDALQSTVLKLGHHGSKTSSADTFLGFVNPEYAVVSAGCNNSYGHPHKEVLEKLETFKIKALNTCKHGTIVFESDGTEVTVSS